MQAAALCKAKKELAALEEYISSVPDATIRSIMRYRYIDGWGWLRIAMRFGWRDETTPHKKIQDFLSDSGFSVWMIYNSIVEIYRERLGKSGAL